ncbi:hypothetical protein BFP77_03805 [Maribacter sp. 4U21]|nr:hypothetical protein BFP77_03805 [Maribacter sp. 4U21]
MPFFRIYFQGAQNKSHFLKVFGSLSKIEERGAFVRNTNEEGFGVYERGLRDFTVGRLVNRLWISVFVSGKETGFGSPVRN